MPVSSMLIHACMELPYYHFLSVYRAPLCTGDCNCHMTSYCHLLHISEGLLVESNTIWQELCLGKGKTAGS